MRHLILCALVLCASGCRVEHQEGGWARQEPPPMGGQLLVQPQNPEGVSKQTWQELVTTHHPDGSIVVARRDLVTELSGSQSLVDIVRATMTAELLRRVAVGLLLLAAAVPLFFYGWPIVAGLLAAGGVVTFFTSLWTAVFIVLTAVLVAFAWLKAKVLL